MAYCDPDTRGFSVVEGSAIVGQKLGEKSEKLCGSDAMQQLIEEIKRECGDPKCLLQELQQEMSRSPVGALLVGDAGAEYPPA